MTVRFDHRAGKSSARRRHIESRLRRRALLGRAYPRPVRPHCDSTREPPSAAGRLCDALSELGALFRAVGGDLSSRRDLLPAAICTELAGLAEAAAPKPALVESLADGVDIRIDPRASGWSAAQSFHRATLADGTPARVVLPRHDLATALGEDLDHLDLLSKALSRVVPEAAEAQLQDAVESAAARLARALDLRLLAEGWRALRIDTRERRRLAVPRLLSDDQPPVMPPGTEPVLLVEEVGQRGLDELAERVPVGSTSLLGVARRLALAWLEQVLDGGVYALDPAPWNLELDPGGRVIFRGGPFVWPESAWQERARAYLLAVVAQSPDDALEALVGAAGADDQLRRDFRLALQPDGEVDRGRRGVAEEIALHSQLLSRADVPLAADWPLFFRALVGLDRTLACLAPEHDVLAAALETLATEERQRAARARLDPRVWRREVEPHLALLAALPERLDSVTRSLAEGSAGVRVEVETPKRLEAPVNQTVWPIAALLILLWAGGLVPVSWSEDWLEGSLVLPLVALLCGWLAARWGRSRDVG